MVSEVCRATLMQHISSLDSISVEKVWLTIGSFDGVHRGHQEIVNKLVKSAKEENANSVVLTFYPHPSVILRGRKDRFYLTTPDRKAALLGNLGVDYVITHPFNAKFASLSAENFLNMLLSHLDIKKIIVGYNFALGKNREGDVTRLGNLGRKLGYSLEVFSPILIDNDLISSSKIRYYLMEGNLREANRLLGRPHQLTGIVQEDKRFPEAVDFTRVKILVDNKMAIPKTGTYVSRIKAGGNVVDSVTSVSKFMSPGYSSQPFVLTSVFRNIETNSNEHDISVNFIELLHDKQHSYPKDSVQEHLLTDFLHVEKNLSQ